MIASMRAAVAGPTVAPQAMRREGDHSRWARMRGRHVRGVGARLVFHVAAHVARHAPPVLKELDRGRCGAEVEPLAPELPGDAVVVVLERDVVVDADLRARPERELVGPGRQRTERCPLDRLEAVAPRLAE